MTHLPPHSRAWRTLQRLAAAFMLLLLTPLFMLLWVLVRATSPGPFLYRQSRRGLHEEPFWIIKIRTMDVGADRNPDKGLAVTLRDPQVTRVGRILRDLKLDELPQLLNILRGEMEWVGPRAISDSLDARLRRDIPGFERRYALRPGLTNVGQVCVLDNAQGHRLLADWRLRARAEAHYLTHKSWSYDLVVIAMTALFLARKLLRRAAASRRPGPVLGPRVL